MEAATNELQTGFGFPAPPPHVRDVELSRSSPDFSAEFSAWLEMNPDIWKEFCKLSQEMRERRDSYSAQAIIEVLRWHRALRDPTDDVFKINNNWAAPLARLFNTKYQCEFFRTRASPGEPFQAKAVQP